jgi:hypothetical protein
MECYDVFSLGRVHKKCTCGKTEGQYVDNLFAEYKGPCMPLGFDNTSFAEALKNQPKNGYGKRFEAFVIPEECDTFMNLNTPSDDTEEIRI